MALNDSSLNSQCYMYENDINFKTYLSIHHANCQTSNICIEKSSVSYPRENATFLMLCRNSDMYEVLQTVQIVQDRFNNKFNYDYTFLNDEPFTDEFIYLISSYITKGKINFGMIPTEHWWYPSHINQTLAQEIRENFADVPYGNLESYRHMCRYFSGFFYKHPMVRQYQYYWRIEPNIKLTCDINEDLFKFIKVNDKKYGFVISLFEYSETIPTLWSNVLEFIKLKNLKPELLHALLNDYDWYNLCHFWSNFEIANLDIFNNNEIYEEFFKFLDSKGGFYYERWGDAPIHTIGLMLSLKKEDFHWFNQVGYYHPPFSACPQNSKIYLENKCVCDPEDDVNSNNQFSCTNHFLKLLKG
ncbi:uncharacterized protein KGF55_003404 [Candida pseudojiufengensis]|uniref:uncharacterized protein n=1 Tax=Candida pseudojiufengensis TaxID=497109 RepID=UPI0022257C1B|nr:uncharacterized protein KGF55_003404 [Candida pseudojiufengensis]KAI5962328.1 hypothetical protein KGF55_003404 [Candida pseudojiufengensis]